jgi:hypothetical protein
MNVPVTAIDQRYSDPEAEAVSWEDTRRLLEAAEIAWLSGPDRPSEVSVSPPLGPSPTPRVTPSAPPPTGSEV